MQINFTGCTITAVSTPYVYDNPQNMDCKTIFNITVCCQEPTENGQTAMVGYGLSYSLNGSQNNSGFNRGDVVNIEATMRGRWIAKYQRTENEMYVNKITKVNS